MARHSCTPVPSISELLQELEGMRLRLAQAAGSFDRPEDSLKAGALAEEVKRLCRESAESGDPIKVSALLRAAKKDLEALQALLAGS